MLIPYMLTNIFTATAIEQAPLEEVIIFFDTATYDEIERDIKVCKDTLKIIQSHTSYLSFFLHEQNFW